MELKISKNSLISEIERMNTIENHPGICIDLNDGTVLADGENTDNQILWISNDGEIIETNEIDWDSDKLELERQLNEGWPGHFTITWIN